MSPNQRIERRFQSARHVKLEPEALREVPPISVQTRADYPQGNPPRSITGYAAVFGVDTVIQTWFGEFKERIKKGAFRRALREGQDVRALMNHDPNLLLGRSVSKTLRMSEDDIGLSVEIDTADTCVGRDCSELISRGDMSGMSFAFIPRKITWINGADGEPDLRIIEDVDLFDVGPVTYPVYQQTSAEVEEYSQIHQEGLRQMADENVISPEEYESRTSRKGKIKTEAELTPAQIREIDESRNDDPPSKEVEKEEEAPAAATEIAPVLEVEPAECAPEADKPESEAAVVVADEQAEELQRNIRLLELAKAQREKAEAQIET